MDHSFIVTNIVLPIVLSLLTAFVFWLLSVYWSPTNVCFSKAIERSRNPGGYPGNLRYRIKLSNTGTRDLIEVRFVVKLSIKKETATNYTYLGLGNDNFLPVMLRASQRKDPYKLTLHLTEASMAEFAKEFYPDSIRKKAENKELALEDILEEYGEKVKITVYVFGNDRVTGTRKMFSSKEYQRKDIIY